LTEDLSFLYSFSLTMSSDLDGDRKRLDND
jgi:hypothetical protein